MNDAAPVALTRQVNSQAVMDAIIHHGPISRAQIAKRIGISKQTVSEVVRMLEAARWIHQTGRVRGAVGRTAVTYELNPKAGYVIGVDLGGSKLRGAIADLACTLLAEDEQRTDGRGGRHVVRQIGRLCRHLAERTGTDWTRVLFVAVGTPGVANPLTGGIDYAPNIPKFDTIAVERALREELGVPVLLENDVNAAALGERWQGHGHGCDNFVFIALGTGLGMGLVVDGQLRRGAHGAAGEIAYLPLGGDPFDPALHQHGTLEEAVGGAGIVRRYRARGGAAGRDVPDIIAAAAAGEPAAVAVLDETTRLVALTIAAVAAVLDPERVVLGGGIGSRPELLGPVRERLAALMNRPVPVEISRLGNRAAMIGALAAALERAHHSLFAARATPENLRLPARTLKAAVAVDAP